MVFDPHVRKLTPLSLRSPSSWEEFFAKFNACLHDSACQQLTIDFHKVEFVTPEIVIIVISAARLWHRSRGTPVTVNFSDDVQSYLVRMNVYIECAAWLVPMRRANETLDRSYNSARLMEVTAISSKEDENARGVVLATTRANQILQNADVPADRTREISKLLSEVGQNVVHSNDIGYVIIQRYRMKSQNTYCVRVGIGDLGYGIQKTLSARYSANELHCRSGSDYLVRALNRKLSSRQTEEGGAGLAHIQERVIESSGELIIRSGTSRIWVRDIGITQADGLPDIPGVQVFITAYGTVEDWQ